MQCNVPENVGQGGCFFLETYNDKDTKTKTNDANIFLAGTGVVVSCRLPACCQTDFLSQALIQKTDCFFITNACCLLFP